MELKIDNCNRILSINKRVLKNLDSSCEELSVNFLEGGPGANL